MSDFVTELKLSADMFNDDENDDLLEYRLMEWIRGARARVKAAEFDKHSEGHIMYGYKPMPVTIRMIVAGRERDA